jgi:hypothetical protein
MVVDPAGLSQTFFPPECDHDSRIALVRGVAAEGTDGAMYNSRYARALAHPAFGVVAATADLARFGSMFMPHGPRFLSEPSVRAMTTDQTGGVPGVHPSMQGYATDVRVPWAIGFALQAPQLPGLYSDDAGQICLVPRRRPAVNSAGPPTAPRPREGRMKRILWLAVAAMLIANVPQASAQTGQTSGNGSSGTAGTTHTHAKHGTGKHHKTTRHGATAQKNRKHARHSTHKQGHNG